MTDILTWERVGIPVEIDWERVGIPVEIDSPKKLHMITLIG